MAFRKKNREANAPVDGGSEETGQGGGVAVATAPKKKRKPQEMLSSVVRESTAGAAVALLRENTAFALPNGKSWVVLALPAKNIDGLSMKQKNDEAKGSIIELITADEIATVATLDMLESEVFGIIPSEKSLGRMDEFSLLTNAAYLWVVLTQTPEGTLSAEPVSEATYEQAVEVAAGRSSIAGLLPDVWAWGGGSAADAATTVMPVAGAVNDEPLVDQSFDAGDDEGPFGSHAADDEPVDYNALAEEENDPVDAADFTEFENQFSPEAAEAQMGHSGGTAPLTEQADFAQSDRVVDEDEVRAAIARRFLSAELDLEVDLETFEVNFTQGAAAISFPMEEDASDWLGQQVNQLARQANVELEMLRSHNESELRGMYVSLMSQHAEQVIADVSPDREGSYYNLLMKAAQDDRADRRRAAPEDIAAQRRELNERYEAEAATRGRQAAEQAVQRYKEQNRARHERELAEIGLATERASEEFFDGAQKIILDTRRRDAVARMDLGKTKVLEVLMERHQVHREAEEELVKRWSAEMMTFIDAYRKDDIARSETLAIHLSRENEIEALKAEHAKRMGDLRSEQAARVSQLEEERRKAVQDAQENLASRQRIWQQEISLEQERSKQANSRTQELLEQFSLWKQTSTSQYEEQIKALKADKKSHAQELSRMSNLQARANKVMVLLILVVAVAMLAVGFIFGAQVSGAASAAGSAAEVWLGAAGLVTPPA